MFNRKRRQERKVLELKIENLHTNLEKAFKKYISEFGEVLFAKYEARASNGLLVYNNLYLNINIDIDDSVDTIYNILYSLIPSGKDKAIVIDDDGYSESNLFSFRTNGISYNNIVKCRFGIGDIKEYDIKSKKLLSRLNLSKEDLMILKSIIK